jgi:cytochrome c
MRPTLTLTAATLVLAGAVAFDAAAGQTPTKARAAAPPPTTFARCAVCHNADKGGADKLGPNLWGIYGTKAGLGKFAFSPAMRKSGVQWNDANLDKWIAKPATLVPGTRMAFPGISDPAKRAELIAWLKTRR